MSLLLSFFNLRNLLYLITKGGAIRRTSTKTIIKRNERKIEAMKAKIATLEENIATLVEENKKLSEPSRVEEILNVARQTYDADTLIELLKLEI